MESDTIPAAKNDAAVLPSAPAPVLLLFLYSFIATEVDWLPDLQLPARFVKQFPNGAVTLTLSACDKESQFPVKPITKAELDLFRRLYYADLGDMEDGPIVHHIEQLLGSYDH